MATMDDKLMGEKLHYYCSSSEDEGEDDEGKGGGKGSKATFVPEAELQAGASGGGGAGGGAGPGVSNTGPKGVIEDWRRFKQLERESRAEQDRERTELAKRLAMTCRTAGEDEIEKAKEQQKEEDLEALLDVDEAFLESYMRRRMREMVEQTGRETAAGGAGKRFGKLLELSDGDALLTAVDSEPEGAAVVVLVHEEGGPGCARLTGCLRELAAEYPSAKFCRIAASAAGLSRHFESGGVPALLVYRRGELVSNFVRVTDALGGEDFFASDVESLLVEHGVVQDKELVPQIIKGPAVPTEDSDSD